MGNYNYTYLPQGFDEGVGGWFGPIIATAICAIILFIITKIIEKSNKKNNSHPNCRRSVQSPSS